MINIEEIRGIFINIIKAMPYLGEDNWCRVNTFFVMHSSKQWDQEALGMDAAQASANEFYTRAGGNKVSSGYLAWECREVSTDCDLRDRCRYIYLTLAYDPTCAVAKACKEIVTKKRAINKASEVLIAIIKEAWKYGRYVDSDGNIFWGTQELAAACYEAGNYSEAGCESLKDILKIDETAEVFESIIGRKGKVGVTIKIKIESCDPVGEEVDFNYTCDECKTNKGLVLCPC